ncbi:hypothetical protein IIC45_00455, partial [Patescibacteria group bacterium]|nr:hypothetical protein [Patescibacteria group bacterium]
ADTELPDRLRIRLAALVRPVQEFQRAGSRDRSEMLDEIFTRHADSIVGDRESSRYAIGFEIDREGFEGLLDAYYKERGWDVATGRPTRKKLEELDLKVPGGRIFIHDEFFLSSGFGKKRTDPTWGHVMLTAMVNMTTGTILTGHKSPSSG